MSPLVAVALIGAVGSAFGGFIVARATVRAAQVQTVAEENAGRLHSMEVQTDGWERVNAQLRGELERQTTRAERAEAEAEKLRRKGRG